MAQNKKLEDEANLFAILLLMPKKFIENDIAKGVCLTDDNKMIELARKYDVPLAALVLRIAHYNKYNQ